MQKVEALHQLIGKLGKGKPFPGIAAQTLLYRILGHHVVYRNVLAYIANEIQKGNALHPVVVVHHFGPVGQRTAEIEKTTQLLFDALLIVPQGGLIEQIALGIFHRRVANHPGSPTYQHNGLVTGYLKMLQHHHAHQVSDVQRIGRRVDAHIGRRHFFFQHLFRSGHDVVNHPAPLEFLNKVHSIYP